MAKWQVLKWSGTDIRACYGMEWKMVRNGRRIRVRNGRRIRVRNLQDAQNGMEDLKNEMEDCLPY